MAASRTKNTTYLGARYRRLVLRTGKPKAIVALEHSILIAAWHMLTHQVPTTEAPCTPDDLFHLCRSEGRHFRFGVSTGSLESLETPVRRHRAAKPVSRYARASVNSLIFSA